MINYLIFGVSYSFACVVQPGPFQAFLLSRSLTNGWRKTIPLVFAPLISDTPIIIIVLLFLTTIPHEALYILQCAGGIFLLYLAYRAYITWSKLSQSDKKDIIPGKNLFSAVIVNLLNPAPYIGWSTVMGPQLIKGWSENPASGIILLSGFYGSMVIYSALMVVLFAATGRISPRVNRIMLGISVIVLIIFGFYQLGSGIRFVLFK